MARPTIVVDSCTWKVYLTGRSTVYGKAEFGLLFQLGTGPKRKRRFTRYWPRGSKSTDASLAELTERQLLDFFHLSQPAWTSPEDAYGARCPERGQCWSPSGVARAGRGVGREPATIRTLSRNESERTDAGGSAPSRSSRVRYKARPAAGGAALAERARGADHTDRLCSQRRTLVATDSPLWFPDRRVGERRGVPSRRSGVDRRHASVPGPAEWRRGERRVRADRRRGTERRRRTTAE